MEIAVIDVAGSIRHSIRPHAHAVGHPVVLHDGLIAFIIDEGRDTGRSVLCWNLTSGQLESLAHTEELIGDLASTPTGLMWSTWPVGVMPWDASSLVQWSMGSGEVRVLPTKGPAKSPGAGLEEEWWIEESGEWFLPHRRDEHGVVQMDVPSDFNPPWTFGRRWGANVDDGTVHVATRSSASELWWWRHNGESASIETGLCAIDEIDAEKNLVLLVGSDGIRGSSILEWNLDLGEGHVLFDTTPAFWPLPTAVQPTHRVTESGVPFVYLAANGPERAQPGVVLWAHGGPTGHAGMGLHPTAQMLVGAGWSVAFVDYRGSTSYGRTYRTALRGAYGVADVEDILDVGRWLVTNAVVDADRVACLGSSSGGMTALLCARDSLVSRVIAHYPVTDAFLLAEETEEIESGYMKWLIGSLPEAHEKYVAVSPMSQPALTARCLLTHGVDDAVVPVAHSRAYVAAQRELGADITYTEMEGEGHGYRRPESIARVGAAVLEFLSS
jgi:dipeptidyl aminopeptidase/acylaminoacyl peptidase